MAVALPEQAVIGLCCVEFTDHLPRGIDKVAIPINHADIRMFLQVPYRGTDSTRLVGVIGIDPGQDIALGLRKPLIDGISLTFVLFANPPDKFTLVFLDHSDGVICGAAVHDSILNLRVILCKHGLDCVFNIAILIKRGCHD